MATPTSENLGFAPNKLEAFLRESLPGLAGSMRMAPVAGGQSNPTFFVSFDNRELVVRKRPGGELLPSAHAVDREFKVLSALARTGIPVPRTMLLHEAPDVVGTAFYVMERVEGRIFHDISLPGATAGERHAMFSAVAEKLAALHAVDVVTVGLEDFGRPQGYYPRQLARWSRQWELSKTGDNPDVAWLIGWLNDHVPADSGRVAVAHGDYRIGNLMFSPAKPTIAAILDWELATLGEPLADLAHCCAFTWWMRPEEYGGVLGLVTPPAGMPTEQEFCDLYYAAAGDGARLTAFHRVFALFRSAAIFEGIAARAKHGTAAAANAASVGRLSGVLAVRAIELARNA